MIIFIIGKYGAGKDTFADLLVDALNPKKGKKVAEKVLSYTTRLVRDVSDFDNHRFARYWKINPDDNYMKQDKVVAWTKIDGEYYWSEVDQFKNDFNIYVIDPGSIQQVIDKNLDFCCTIHITRDKIDIPKAREVRPLKWEDVDVDIEVHNDEGLDKLKEAAEYVKNWVLEVQENLNAKDESEGS